MAEPIIGKDLTDEEIASYVYTYDLAEIDECVNKMQQGIMPAIIDDIMRRDIIYRTEELRRCIDEEDEDIQITKREAMQRKIEQQKRKATTKDVLIIQLSDEQKKQIHDDMSVSYVRADHTLRYHISDDKLFDSVERKEIYTKLTKLQKQYYSMNEWIDAMKVIMEAISFSLDHDYPWLSHEQAVEEWNKGKIKFTFCPIPQLWTSWTTSITDPEMLKGVLNGEVTVQTAHDKITSRPKVSHKNAKGINYDYQIISDNEFKQLQVYHQQGYDTPISPIIRAMRGTFNRFSLPENNYFYQNTEQQQDRVPIAFDWEHEGAGYEYFRLVNGITDSTDDIVDFISAQNDHKLGPVLRTSLDEFLSGMKSGSSNTSTGFDLFSYNAIPNELERATVKEIELEKRIMDQMTIVTP